MDAMEQLARLQARHGPQLGSRLQPLQQAVTDLDFEAALRHCHDLRDTCTA
jgi:hypothetical protein